MCVYIHICIYVYWVDNIRMDLQEVGCGYMTGLGWPRIETFDGRL